MNPSDRSCWQMCTACMRCAWKGSMAKCNTCSGRHDPLQRRDPTDIDDYCRCREGILQFRLQTGKMIQRRYKSDPYGGKVRTDAETKDEQEWNQYIKESREKLDDERWDPVRLTDGTSTHDWMKRQRGM